MGALCCKYKNKNKEKHHRKKYITNGSNNGIVNEIQKFVSSIIFTPKYPVETRSRKRFTLVLDLDETLIHTTTSARHQVFSKGRKVFPDLVLEVPVQGRYCIFYVYMRPYLHTFLREISKWFEVVIFTASERRYAEPLVQRIGMYILQTDSFPLKTNTISFIAHT